ncbi:MAG: tyrosine protein phosphatase [Blastocatellia bacterium]
MMRSAVYWIDGPWAGRLAIVPRPRGWDWLEDEAAGLRNSGFDVIVSLLEKEEAAELGLELEERHVRAAGGDFISFPIVDRNIPASRKDAADLVNRLGKLLTQGKQVGIHCRQSIGRASLIAAALLVAEGIAPDDAFERIGAARGCPVPETEPQREWVRDFALQAAA